MEIAILYIATKRYKELWKKFHSSCESFFVKEATKTYYVFTDDTMYFINRSKAPEHLVQIKDEPNWYDVSLNRFDYFLSKKQDLAKYDYLFFFNANTIFQGPITTDMVIPALENDYMIGSSMYKLSKAYYPKCSQKSSCYIPQDKIKDRFYIGGFIGGRSKEFLDVCEKCSLMIAEDRKRNLIPDTNDEYYYNKALEDKNPLLVTSVGSGSQSNAPILFYNKQEILGKDYISSIKSNNKILQRWQQLFQRK